MNKSVLIIDTPSNCKECPVSKCKEWTDEEARPKECKLHRLPPAEPCNYYNFETYSSGFAHGFNRFREQITGESV